MQNLSGFPLKQAQCRLVDHCINSSLAIWQPRLPFGNPSNREINQSGLTALNQH